VYSYDGSSLGGLTIAETVDWDIPSDSLVRNTFGYDETRKLIFQQGVDYASGPTGCQNNADRFGGLAFLGYHINDGELNDTTQPYGCTALDVPTYVYPNGNYVPGELYPHLKVAGYTPNAMVDDLASFMVYFDDYTVVPGETLFVYTSYCSVQDASARGGIGDVADRAKRWFNRHVKSGAYVCGDVDGNSTVNVSDIVMLINFVFGDGGPPEPMAAGDVDCNETVNVSDIVYLIAFVFGDGAEPCADCP
jgi:hypothetical protein